MSEPETTAIVISHNHAPYILQCLESIRDQTIQPTRIVLVDDGSSDSSFSRGSDFVTRHFSEHRLIGHPEPVGLCRSLNEALAHSRGEYIQEIAADDYWLPEKTASQLAIFSDAANEPAVVVGDALLVDAAGQPSGGTFLDRFVPAGLPPADQLFSALLRRNLLPAMAMMIRRESLVDVGGWDESLMYEDWDMWLRLSDRWPFIYQDEVVAAYRYLPSSMSNARAEEMWLSKLAISRKWAGTSLRADLGALERSATVTVRASVRGDWRFARQWWRLLLAIVIRRLRPH
jgi:glycosyltransferase involved in cell wall biosynthesis